MAKRISIKDVAAAANVSPGTVSNYLNKSAPVNSETKKRIEHSIRSLNYRRNEVASSLRRAKTHTFGIILPDIANPFYAGVYLGAEQAALERGYTVILANTQYQTKAVDRYLDVFYSRQVDGIILDAFHRYVVPDSLGQARTPIVILEPPANAFAYPTVNIDNISACSEVVRHLVRRGHSRIALITRSDDEEDLRYIGYCQGLAQHGIPVEPELVYALGSYGSDILTQGNDAMVELLDRTSFSACFATTDILALGAFKCLRDRGLRVPEDVALAGFDNISSVSLVNPPLTTVEQPDRLMGAEAVRFLLRDIDADGEDSNEIQHSVLDTRLMIRASTGK